ncbi:MAG TPA: DUF2993 domain-containing protein [Trichocoleus sp.]
MEGDLVQEKTAAKGSRVISRILPAAVRLWLQAQVEHVDNLVFELEGRDREILSGYLPGARVAADRAVYQGLHLSQVQVAAQEIRINLGQVLRGKPLRLQQRFPIVGEVVLREADLAASLQAPLLQEGLRDFLRQLIAVQGADHDLRPYLGALVEENASFQVETVAIAPRQIALTLRPASGAASQPLVLKTDLTVREGHILVLQQPSLQVSPETEPLQLDGFDLDLGPEVNIDALNVTSGQIEINGTVQVVPAD